MTATTFDDKQAAGFRSQIRSWLEATVPDRWRNQREHLSAPEVREVQRRWDMLLHESGYAGLSWPVEYGGRGMGAVEELIYYQESARANAPEALGPIGPVPAGPTIIACGTAEQHAKYLPRILDGAEIWCQGFSQPGAGSDLAAVANVANRTDGGYLVAAQN